MGTSGEKEEEAAGGGGGGDDDQCGVVSPQASDTMEEEQ